MSLRACDDRVLVPAIRAKSFAAWHAGYATVFPYCERISIVIVFMLYPLCDEFGVRSNAMSCSYCQDLILAFSSPSGADKAR